MTTEGTWEDNGKVATAAIKALGALADVDPHAASAIAMAWTAQLHAAYSDDSYYGSVRRSVERIHEALKPSRKFEDSGASMEDYRMGRA